MRRLRFWINTLILLVPLGFLALFTNLMVRRLWTYLNSNAQLAGILSAEATRALGREVRVRDVKITGNLWSLAAKNKIELFGVSIAQDPAFPGTHFARAEKITVHYNLQQLLLSSDPKVPLVDSLDLVAPMVTLDRDQRGRWNFDQLLKKPTANASRPFADKLTFSEATLRYADQSFPHPSGVTAMPLNTYFSYLGGTVLIRPDKSAFFDVAGRGEAKLFQTLHATGIYSPSPLSIESRIVANGVNLPNFGRRFIPPGTARIGSGIANIDVAALYAPPVGTPLTKIDPAAIDAHGTVSAIRLALDTPTLGAPLTDVSGSATFTSDSVTGNYTGAYSGVKFAIGGSLLGLLKRVPGGSAAGSPPVKIAIASPTVSLHGTLPNADFAVLLRAAHLRQHFPRIPASTLQELGRITGHGSLDFQIAGALDNPTATLKSSVQTANAWGYGAKNLVVDALLDNRIVNADVRGQVAEGNVVARVRIGFNAQTPFDVEAHGRGVQLAAVRPLADRRIAGKGDIDATIRGQAGRTPYISAQALFGDVKINNQPLRSVYARAATVGRQLVVRQIRIEDEKGFALASGTVDLSTRKLALNVEADELNLGTLRRALMPNAGNPSGAATHAKGSATASTRAGNRTSAAGQKIALGQRTKSAAATPPAGTIIAVSTKPTMLDISQLEGIGYLRGAIGGTLDKPVAQGKLSAFGVSAGMAGVDKVTAEFTVSRSLLTLAGQAERYPGAVTFEGTVREPLNPAPRIAFSASAEKLDIADLLHLTGISLPQTLPLSGSPAHDKYIILGTVSTDAVQIAGTPTSLQIQAPFTLSLNQTSINGLPIDSATVRARYIAKSLQILDAKIALAGGTLTATGTVGTDGQALLDVTGSSLDFAKLADVLPDALPAALAGSANIHAVVRGAISDPHAAATFAVSGLTIDGLPVGAVEGSLDYADKEITVHDTGIGEPVAAASAVLIAPASVAGPSPNTVHAVPTHKNVAVLPAAGLREITIPKLVYNFDDGGIAGDIRLNSLRLQRVRSLYESSAFAATDTGKQISDTLTKLGSQFAGTVDGSAHIIGTASDPQVDVDFHAANIQVQSHLVAAIRGSALITKKSIVSPSPFHPDDFVRIESEDATIDAKNISAVYDGDVTADVSAYNIKLDILKRWIDQQNLNDLSGEGDILFTVSGRTKAPVFDASVSLRDVTYRDQVFRRIEVSHAVVTQKQITIDDIAVVKVSKDLKTQKEYRFDANAHGSMDFSWKAPFVTKDTRINAEIVLPEQEFSSFAAFTPSASQFDGRYSLRLGITNTLGNPRPTSGAMHVESKSLPIGRMRLLDLNGTLTLVGDHIHAVDGFSARTQLYTNRNQPDTKHISDPLILSGDLAINPADRDRFPGLRLSSSRLYFDATPIPGAKNGSMRGTANVGLDFTGSLNDLTLSDLTIGGLISVEEALFSPPGGFEGGSGNGLPLPINPSFDLTLLLGKNVRVSNLLINARTSGEATLKGHLFETADTPVAVVAPDNTTIIPVAPGRKTAVAEVAAAPERKLGLRLYGKLLLEEGKLNLATARFNIVPPGSLTLTYPIPDEADPTRSTLGIDVDLKAQGSLTANSQSGIRKNYRITVTAAGPITGQVTNPLTGESRLALNFSSDPGDLAVNQLGLQQRLAGVLGGDAVGQFGRNPGQVIAQQFTNILTSSVLPSIFDKPAEALGFEELSLNYDPIQRLNLIVRRRLVGPLYLSYNRTLTNTHETYDLKLSLRFRDRYQLSYDVDDVNTQRILLEGFFRF